MSEYIYEHMQSGADHMGRSVEQPTLVQREEVVRCRDCIWFSTYTTPNECFRADGGLIVDPNGFCAWAKRKEGGE